MYIPGHVGDGESLPVDGGDEGGLHLEGRHVGLTEVVVRNYYLEYKKIL